MRTQKVVAYTTCMPHIAKTLIDGTFKLGGYLEVYYTAFEALQMSHPGDTWLVILHIPQDVVYNSESNILKNNIDCRNGLPEGYLFGIEILQDTLDKAIEVNQYANPRPMPWLDAFVRSRKPVRQEG